MHNYTRILAGASLFSLAIGHAGAALAQEDGGAEDYTGEQIIVLGQSLEHTLPQELSRYGYKVETVSEETIRDRGYIDATQALDMEVPGLTMTSTAGPFSYTDISLQGSRNSDVLWTIDGVRIGNRLYNSTSPSDTLPAAMIGHIEVLKGGHGLFYGTQAVAGVINLVTTPFEDETNGEVTVGMNTNSSYQAQGRLNFAAGDHHFIVWGSKNKSRGFQLYDRYNPSVTHRRHGYDVTSGGIKYGWQMTPDLALNLHYIRTEADIDNLSPTRYNVNMREQQIAIGRLDYTPSETAKFYLKTYYHQWDTDYGVPGEPTDYWGFKDFGVNGLAQLDLHQGLDYHIGYEFQNYRGRDESLLIDGETEQVHAVFGQVRTDDSFSRRLRLAAGVRHNESRDSSATVWSASGTYELSDALQFDASIGTSFLLPDAYQLYGVDPCCTRGNPELLPEESFAVNLGVGGNLGGYRWSLAGWDRTIENLISSDSSNPPDGFPSIAVNIEGKVKARGFEALLAGPLGKDFNFLASYTYSEEKARNTGLQIDGRARHAGKGSLSWSPDGPYGASLSAKYFGTAARNVAGFGRQEYGNYFIVDFATHTFLDPETRRWRLGARLENIFDKEYATTINSAVIEGSTTGERFFYNRFGTPQTFYLNLTYQFGGN